MFQRAPELRDGQLAFGGGRTEMGVVQEAAAPGQLEAGRAAEFPDPHRDDVPEPAVALEEIEERVELRRSVGACGYFDEAGA